MILFKKIGNLPDAKLFNGLYFLCIGFDFGTLHTHTKVVPVSNPITLQYFFRNLIMKVMIIIEYDRS